MNPVLYLDIDGVLAEFVRSSMAKHSEVQERQMSIPKIGRAHV